MKQIKAPKGVYGRPATDAERDRLEQFALDYVSSEKTRSHAEVVKLKDLANQIAHGVIGKNHFVVGKKKAATVELVKVIGKKSHAGRKASQEWTAGTVKTVKNAKSAIKGRSKASAASTKD
ncbi:hypothetical protein [Paraburkholderia terrae]|uniref:hypothetical protein n=1 Tax=Paraburkholderia terrae TaxID=311230 RepID=UPI0020C14E13|nr:hypothetical protein [Paraburkholderia terrae]